MEGIIRDPETGRFMKVKKNSDQKLQLQMIEVENKYRKLDTYLMIYLCGIITFLVVVIFVKI